jgi:hypothetical protein
MAPSELVVHGRHQIAQRRDVLVMALSNSRR